MHLTSHTFIYSYMKYYYPCSPPPLIATHVRICILGDPSVDARKITQVIIFIAIDKWCQYFLPKNVARVNNCFCNWSKIPLLSFQSCDQANCELNSKIMLKTWWMFISQVENKQSKLIQLCTLSTQVYHYLQLGLLLLTTYNANWALWTFEL